MTKNQLRPFILGILGYFLSTIVTTVFFSHQSMLIRMIISILILITLIGFYLFYTHKLQSKDKRKTSQNEEDERFHHIRQVASWNTLIVLFVSGILAVVIFPRFLDEALLHAISVMILYGIGVYFLVFAIVRKKL